MTQQHPIPPPELVQQWQKEPGVSAPFSTLPPCVMVTIPNTKLQDIATRAAQWGADQELEACCEWLLRCSQWAVQKDVDGLRDARRKPPSLKEQALLKLKELQALLQFENVDSSCIRRALESIPDPS